MLRFFGPPGTGKTTTLLNLVDDALGAGVDPNKIGYFAYTRKASNVARERAVERFNKDPKKDFLYFRTLHSLSFRLLGLSTEDVLQEAQLKEFSEKIGIDLTSGGDSSKEEGFIGFRSNHPIMRLIDFTRTTLQDPRTCYNRSEIAEPRSVFLHVFSEYARYKRENKILDFTDMLVDISTKPQRFPFFKCCFVDEAQDLTPLQWKLVEILDSHSERMYLAGDDDQGIYRWAGADLNHFVNLPSSSEVLEQSYRIPRKIWQVADTVSKRISFRQEKFWAPRPEDGEVHRIYDTYGLTFPKAEEWLILSQAHYQLGPLAEQLKSSGTYFERFGRASLGERVRKAISSWNNLTEDAGNTISRSEAQNLYNHISSGKQGIGRGAKKRLTTFPENSKFSLGLLQKDLGLHAKGLWSEALDKIKDEDRVYASQLLANGFVLEETPKIRLSTIHGAKGGEADNVLVFLDLSAKALQDMEKTPDDAWRVLYVAVTRARNRLVLKASEDLQRGWQI